MLGRINRIMSNSIPRRMPRNEEAREWEQLRPELKSKKVAVTEEKFKFEAIAVQAKKGI